MYGYYCVIVSVIILLIAFSLDYYFRKKLKAEDYKNNLITCTILAIACAILTPPLARTMVLKLHFSDFNAAVLSLSLLIILGLIVFYLKLKFIDKKVQNSETADSSRAEDGNAAEEAAFVIYTNDNKNSEAGDIQDVAVSSEESDADQIHTEAPGIEHGDEISQVTFEQNEASDHAFDSMENEVLENITADVYPPLAVAEPETEMVPESEMKETSIIEEDKEALTLEEAIDKAMDNKINQNYHAAISYYEKALETEPDNELLKLIVVDLCSLYKKVDSKDQVYDLLNKTDEKLLNSEIKEIILQNL